MTKTLVKKQLLEVFAWLYQDKKTHRHRTGSKLVTYIVLYVLVFGGLAGMFYWLADMLCQPLAAAGMTWLYMAIMCLMGLGFAVFGSVFNTYATLYKAADNDLLLSMPIPVHAILVGRLSGVFAIGAMYEVLVMVPTLIVFFLHGSTTVLGVVFSILQIVLLGILALDFSCILGWVVALVSTKLKNQKILTVLISLVFIAGYYYLCGNAGEIIGRLLENPGAVAGTVKGVFFLLYLAGRGAEGDMLSMLAFVAISMAFSAVVYLVLRWNFLRLATTQKGGKKTVYVEKTARSASPDRALLGKELRRFLGSTSYMLNCGLGIPICLVGAVAILIKRGDLVPMVQEFYGYFGDKVYLVLAMLLCLTTTMCDISAPSVSLEGKSLWLTQVLPVSGYQVLRAKRNVHVLLTLVPSLVLTATVLALEPATLFWGLTPVTVALFVVLMADLGLVLNLRFHSFSWTTEVTPIKQSASVTIALFGGWGLVLVLGGFGLLGSLILTPMGVLGILCVVLLALDIGLEYWLKNGGSRRFEAL